MTEEYAIRNVMQAGGRIKHLGTGVERTVGWGIWLSYAHKKVGLYNENKKSKESRRRKKGDRVFL